MHTLQQPPAAATSFTSKPTDHTSLLLYSSLTLWQPLDQASLHSTQLPHSITKELQSTSNRLQFPEFVPIELIMYYLSSTLKQS